MPAGLKFWSLVMEAEWWVACHLEATFHSGCSVLATSWPLVGCMGGGLELCPFR